MSGATIERVYAREIPGYITEKIFDCFLARSVPVYWGPGNIADHVPPVRGSVMGPCEMQNADGLAFLLEHGAEIADEHGNRLAPVALVLETYCRNPAGKHRCLELLAEHVLVGVERWVVGSGPASEEAHYRHAVTAVLRLFCRLA